MNLPELFDILPWGDELVLTSGEELNDARWGAWFGAIQSLIRYGQANGNHFKSCHINLSGCWWADPLPLLSLALTLVEYERNGGKIRITFPSVPLTKDIVGISKDNVATKQARLLKFLAREGFISLLARPEITHLPGDSTTVPFGEREIKFGANVLGSDGIDSLKDLPVSLAFERSTGLLATLLNLRCPASEDDTAPHYAIDEWVEQVLFQSISQSIYDEAPSWAQDGLRYRLMTFLRETLHNVIEHAYKGSQSGLAAVYVRYREGALGEAPATWTRISVFSKREDDQNQVPLMKTQSWRESFPNIRTGFFEVFVLDAGQGLCRALGEYSSNDGSNPLHKVMLEVFDLGRSSKKVRPTKFGGLYLIGELLTPNEDYIRALDEGTWWGTQLPLKKTQAGSQPSGRFTINAYGKEFGNEGIRGLAWTARLSWLEAQDVPGHMQPWREIGAKKVQLKVLAVFRNIKADPIFSVDVVIRDVRFPTYHSPIVPDAMLCHDAPTILLLPEPRWMKNHIQDEIRHLLDLLNGRHNGILIIGDIRPEEAITYLAAIAGAEKFTLLSYISVKRVILVTRELKVCVLQRTRLDGLLEPNYNETMAFFLGNVAAQHFGLVEYLRTLRNHDGQRLRTILDQAPLVSNHADFISEEVNWNNGVFIKGYLDFPQTLTHPLCREIYALSLQRLTGLFPRLDCHLVALDSLVDSLITRFNAQNHSRPSSRQVQRKHQPIQIGSIKVSGKTELAGKQVHTPVFHFFRHPSGKADGYFLLPWIGPSEITNAGKHLGQYRRVGETPVIARDGWKAYSLPRFDKGGLSIYEQSPKDSYRAWQESSRTPMKIGHWSYGGHHEILTINLLLAFDTELDRISLALGGSLARFAYANFFNVFGISEANLNEQGKKLFSIVAGDKYRHLLSAEIGKKVAEGNKPLLVYPSHPVTDHIIDRFLGLLSEESLIKIRDQLIAILPVRRHRSGSGLQVSGITLERLGKAANPNRPVVYFDDGVISGRTYEEIKRLLRNKGFRDIYSLVLLDRQRLPSSDHMQNGQHVGYWRLDVPSLGSKAHCPLCHAIERVQSLRDSIASPAHRTRIESWCQTWKERDSSTQWGDTGLRPIPLTLNKPERKYGVTRNPDGSYSQIGGDTQQIRLTNSAGLIAWVTELHCITSRDDLPLEILQKESLSSEVRIQLFASQLLLFLPEFDLGHAKKLIIALLQALWDSPAHDRHTALAVLTLVSCGDDLFQIAINNFFDSDKLIQLKDRNVDVVLLKTLSMVTEGNKTGRFGVDSTLDVCSRLLKPCGKPGLYYRLHREVKDALGKAHSSPLHRLKQTKDHAHFEAKEILMDMLASAAQLRAIAQSIPWHWLRANTDGHMKFMAIKNSIEESEERLRQAVVKLQGTEEFDGQHQKQFEDAKKNGGTLLENGDGLHYSLFAPLGIVAMKGGHATVFLDQLRKLHCTFSTDSGEKIACWHIPGLHESRELEAAIKKPEIAEAFVVWDAEIREALQDIISNVRHVKSSKIFDPWGAMTESAHLWCRISMSEFSFNIEMKNKSDQIASFVTQKVEGRHSHHVIREIGGEVKYTDAPDGLLLTTISLPYAHTLQTVLPGVRQ